MHYLKTFLLLFGLLLVTSLAQANDANEQEKRKQLAIQFLSYLSEGNIQKIRPHLSKKALTELEEELSINKKLELDSSMTNVVFSRETLKKDGSWQEHFKENTNEYGFVLSVLIILEDGEYKITLLRMGYVAG